MFGRLGGVVGLLYGVTAPFSTAAAGNVDFELRPPSQTVQVGDPVEIELYAVSADGLDQSVGFVGAVFTFNANALELVGHDDTGAFAWGSSAFPSEGGGVNNTFADGTAYYQGIVVQGGPLATATASGLLVTTLQFTARSAGTGTHDISIVPCLSSTCSRVLDRHPFTSGVLNVTGSLGSPAGVTILCDSAGECDDANPCTDDACGVENLCVLTPNDNNDPSDGFFCNGVEICENGQVAVDPNTVPDCDDDLPCTTDSCNEAGNVCNNVLQNGFCLIANECHSNGTLNPVNDCAACLVSMSTGGWSPRPAGSACGNPALGECDLADTCDEAGACQANLRPAGFPCGSGAPNVCTDPDSCDGFGACDPHNVSDGTSCDDALWCTTTDACTNGLCVGVRSPCPGQTCDEATDRCKAVNLELFASSTGPFAVDDLVDVQIYANSDIGVDLAIGSLTAILTWNPSQLELVGRLDNGPYNWFTSGFPNDSALDGLNNTFADGDAWYQASSQPMPNPPAQATVNGLLITTIRFRALAAGTAVVAIDDQRGQYSETVVGDYESPGLNITGSLGAPVSVTLVQCLDQTDCDDGELCNGSETCSGMSCVPGPPPDCDDGEFCNGAEICQFGVGCISPGNPCPDPTSCDEQANNCGGCDSPIVVAEGGRYLRVTPPTHSTPVALLIKGDPNDPYVDCFEAYVQTDGTLGSTPVFHTPAEWSTVHVSGVEMTPYRRHLVHTDCRFEGAGYLSAASAANTWKWGDVNGDGVADINDALIVIDASNGEFPPGVSVPNVDLLPCDPDGVVDQMDVDGVEDAIGGQSSPCAAVCEACVSIQSPFLPPNPTARNRYLAFRAGNAGEQTAIRVRMVSVPPPHQALNGKTLFVAQPNEVCENAAQTVPPPGGCAAAPGQPARTFLAASLQCGPYYTDWSVLGTVHVFHPALVPGGQYQVQAINVACPTSGEDDYSAPLEMATSRWGDIVGDCATLPCTPPDGTVNVSTDVVACLDKFRNLITAAGKSRSDTDPQTPDRLINISDVTKILDAFVGKPYPFAAPTSPCAP